MIDGPRLVAIASVAALGSMINAIAGGGTLLTFPALIALGIPPIVANATSTVALWPGAVGSLLGYRARLAGTWRWAFTFAIPSLAGGGVGALLLLRTSPHRFGLIVPWLVFGATLLFAIQGPVVRRLRSSPASAPAARAAHPAVDRQHPHVSLGPLACQFLVGIYGGYFGAGIGILMLAVLGWMRFTDIHQMNGLKNWGGLCMNLVAATIFAFSGIVDWMVALSMAIGAIIGGYVASRAAQRVPQRVIRDAIIAIGIASGTWLWWVGLS